MLVPLRSNLTFIESFQERIEEAQKLKDRANEMFSTGKFDDALSYYDDAIAALPPRPAAPQSENGESEAEDLGGKGKGKANEVPPSDLDAEDAEVQKLRAVLHCNTAACHLKLEQWKEAVRACGEALIDEPNYVKALHRRATANEKIGTWSGISAALEGELTEDMSRLTQNSDGDTSASQISTRC